MLTSSLWNQTRLTENFNAVCIMVSIRCWLLFL